MKKDQSDQSDQNSRYQFWDGIEPKPTTISSSEAKLAHSKLHYIDRVLRLEKQVEKLKDILKDVVFESDPKTGEGSGIENYTWDKIKQALK